MFLKKIINALQNLFVKRAVSSLNLPLENELNQLISDLTDKLGKPVLTTPKEELTEALTKPEEVVTEPPSAVFPTSTYFKPSEFVSRNDKNMTEDKLSICPVMLDMLNRARELDGNPWKVTSGQRSVEYNKEVGGVAGSSHIKGCAVDISAPSGKRKYEIVQAALKVGFTRIGIGKNFIHLDTDTSKVSPTVWLY